MAELVIRKMEVTDIQQVMEVEKSTFKSPWPEDIFYQEVANNDHTHYFVMEVDKKIVGYAGLWIVIDDVQITNIALMPSYRGHKLGDKLLCNIAFQASLNRFKSLS